MKKKFLAGLVTGLFMLGISEANATSLEFDIDGILPSAQSDISFFNGTGQPESNLYSVSGGLLHQRTYDVDGNASYFWPALGPNGGTLDAANNLSMEARLKVDRIEGSGGAYFQAFDGSYRYSAWFVNSGIEILTSSGSSTILVDISQYHTYRIESPGNSNALRFFVDGTLTFDGLAPAYASLNGFDWGDGRSPAGNGADADWDFVRVSQSVPVPEPATMLLFGTGIAGLAGTRLRKKKQ